MSDASLANPGVRFPPPFLFVAGFLVGLTIDRWVTHLPLSSAPVRPMPLNLAGWLGILLGVGLSAWAITTFRMFRTSIIPNRPARTIVDSGPYRFSRNPMYVALTTLYVGLALLINVAWPLLLMPLVLIALYTLVIRREERYLSDAFRTEYRAYCSRVRRWL